MSALSKLDRHEDKTLFETYGEVVAKRLERLGEKGAHRAFVDILDVLQRHGS